MASIIDKLRAWWKPSGSKSSSLSEAHFESFYQGSTISHFKNTQPYESDIYRAGVDAIARNVAKLKPIHYIGFETNSHSDLNRLLQQRPNEFMTSYDFIYKTITLLYLHNNAFIYLHRNGEGHLVGMFPINYSNVEFGTYQDNDLHIRFTFNDGSDVILPYEDIVHLRRNFNQDTLLGDDNSALDPLLTVVNMQNEGIIRGIQNGANIRGILNFTQLLNDQDLKKKRDDFVKSHLTMDNQGGVVVTDAQTEYTSIDSKSYPIDAQQLDTMGDRVFNYLGIHKDIVRSNYTEDQWASFYESIIEPLATQLSQEFTTKIFSEREQKFGNRIHFETGSVQFASNDTKVKNIKELLPLGIYTPNEARAILNLPPIADETGDKRLMTLNLVDLETANQYQLAKANAQSVNHDEEGGTDEGN
ncbi:phage portal protein [Hutsoniella sourekii]|uniref:phage portal protein n=1 Tax=Hutsoniella sourekii TaxID=87650 RepID=UPI0004B3125A|nr:phage portal protein [Hutsoniella sourekii]